MYEYDMLEQPLAIYSESCMQHDTSIFNPRNARKLAVIFSYDHNTVNAILNRKIIIMSSILFGIVFAGISTECLRYPNLVDLFITSISLSVSESIFSTLGSLNFSSRSPESHMERISEVWRFEMLST
ncbi:hypothetical protein Ahy_B03g065230 isoform B [Arachis hypogaea]|uniref:Uncharacterized protein n=1 Tax=Arachis hypogaea TaxID=3818 RepID=A0A445A143_ARAHY|nr:hypothetical protein Ahy_B03g065230 isoform B [Arachis hypogaea]